MNTQSIIQFKKPVLKNKVYIAAPNDNIKLEIYEAKIKNIQKLKNSNGYMITVYISNNNNELINSLLSVDSSSLTTILENNNTWFDNNLNDNELINLYKPSYNQQYNTLNIILSDNNPINIAIDNECYMDNDKLLEILLDVRNLKKYIINLEIQCIGLFIYKELVTNKWLLKNINISNIESDKCHWNREDIESGWITEVENSNNIIDKKIEDTKKYIDTLINYKQNINDILYEALNYKYADKTWETKLNELKNIIIDPNNRILSTNDNR
jgi:hypothetical protein